MIKNKVIFFVLFLCFSPLLWAQTAPSAGQVIRETERQTPKALGPQSAPIFEAKTPKQANTKDNKKVLQVKQFVIGGNQAISTQDLQALVRPWLDRPLSLSEVQQAVDKISDLYHQRGFVLARAWLPEQEVHDGKVQIQIAEGRYGDIIFPEAVKLPKRVLKSATRKLKSGVVVEIKSLENSLLLLEELPAYKTQAHLKAGNKVGTSDLLLVMPEDKKYQLALSLDNYGNQAYGKYRLNLNGAINNPFHLADKLTFSALLSDGNQHYLSAGYEAPIGQFNTSLGVLASWTDYRLNQEFKSLKAKGEASVLSFYIRQNLLKQRNYGLAMEFAYEYKKLVDDMDLFAIHGKKTLNNVKFDLDGYWYDEIISRAVTSYSVSLVSGKLSLDNQDAKDQNTFLNNQKKFSKLLLSIFRQQSLPYNLSLLMQARWQLANANLDSAEKISLSGAHAVRAYSEGEISGDEAWLASAELRYLFAKQWQAGFFVDAGSVKFKNTPALSQGNRRKVAGAGLALYWQQDAWQASLSSAWALADKQANDDENNYALWARIAWQY